MVLHSTSNLTTYFIYSIVFDGVCRCVQSREFVLDTIVSTKPAFVVSIDIVLRKELGGFKDFPNI